MSAVLTEEERNTLNAAMAIIERHTPQRASWQISADRYSTLPFSFDVTYFDSQEGVLRGQHSFIEGATFADQVQRAIQIEANAAASAETNRLASIAQLRKQLAALEGEAA